MNFLMFSSHKMENKCKGVLLNDNLNSYKPCVYLYCCSGEANFGNDLI
uniref:Uncharacterized protein n=1 Tax=Meloidogyne enterolobii TaxID=390850 RepID=A0A6V7VWQ7_MELEN|nr:unnamed protein product [Meloidogyne enterolobii]